MMTVIIIIHAIACALLIIIVLIQRGRGSGLVESFAGVESMFGTKTSVFLTRATTVLAVVFFFSCLILAILSVRQSRSLLADSKPQPVKIEQPAPKESSAANPQASEPIQGATKQ
jgi:preprotein translocase subunit SecG